MTLYMKSLCCGLALTISFAFGFQYGRLKRPRVDVHVVKTVAISAVPDAPRQIEPETAKATNIVDDMIKLAKAYDEKSEEVGLTDYPPLTPVQFLEKVRDDLQP